MATKIRLCRMGARNNPFYRLVVADSRFATTGRNLEVLGWYDPKKAENNFSVKLDRVDYWTGTGAQASATAKSLIKKARAGEGVAPGAAVKAETPAPAEAAADKPAVEAEEAAPVAEEAPKADATAEEWPVIEEGAVEVPAEEAAAEDSEKQES